MVLSDGMVHFLKIEKKFNQSTKTILWHIKFSQYEDISRAFHPYQNFNDHITIL